VKPVDSRRSVEVEEAVGVEVAEVADASPIRSPALIAVDADVRYEVGAAATSSGRM
jgi:dihydropteroate synthase